MNFICQKCEKQKELEAAHKKGKSRINFIDEVLGEKENLIIKDLKLIVEKIIENHKPINKSFYFLCKNCHLKYDEK